MSELPDEYNALKSKSSQEESQSLDKLIAPLIVEVSGSELKCRFIEGLSETPVQLSTGSDHMREKYSVVKLV